MPHVVRFSREKAQRMLAAISEGKPIQPPSPEGWTGFDMIALAGVCFFATMSHGPQSYSAQGVSTAKLGDEQREAVESTFFSELHAAIEWHANRAREVDDGVFDDQFEPELAAVITSHELGKMAVKPVEGFKSDDAS